jgi:pilus assembly protein CpaB
MGKRLFTILMMAFLIALVCSFLVWRIFNTRISSATQSATRKVIAAKTDIPLGTVLTAANLTTVEIAGTLPKGALLKPEEALGRGATAEIYQGEPILASRLSGPGSGGGLAATIPAGLRACAVKVDDVVGVAGFATPGTRVDVVFTGIPPGAGAASQDSVSRTVLQNIRVLSAGTDYQKDGDGKAKPVQVVNLLVTPEEAETLSLADNQIHIRLILRNPADSVVSEIPGANLSHLLAGRDAATPAPAPAHQVHHTPPPAPRDESMEIIAGAKRTTQKLDRAEEVKEP